MYDEADVLVVTRLRGSSAANSQRANVCDGDEGRADGRQYLGCTRRRNFSGTWALEAVGVEALCESWDTRTVSGPMTYRLMSGVSRSLAFGASSDKNVAMENTINNWKRMSTGAPKALCTKLLALTLTEVVTFISGT